MYYCGLAIILIPSSDSIMFNLGIKRSFMCVEVNDNMHL